MKDDAVFGAETTRPQSELPPTPSFPVDQSKTVEPLEKVPAEDASPTIAATNLPQSPVQTPPGIVGFVKTLEREWNALKNAGLNRRRRVVRTLSGGRCRLDHRELVNLAGNDYLDLAHDERVIQAAVQATLSAGTGATASAAVCGYSPWHEQLVAEICSFEGTPDAVLFPTGYAANLGTLVALADNSSTIFSDRLNHACLIDAAKLTGAKLRIYRHDRLERLDRQLQKTPASGRRFILTDGVFSMDGNLAPLPELCELAERYGAILIVDEAHGTGVYGPNGRGAAEHFGVEHRVHVRVGTLSKAVGALGGFVSGSKALCGVLTNRARTQLFSTALPPAVCAAATAAFKIMKREPGRRTHLLATSQALLTALKRTSVTNPPGLTVPTGVAGPIIPILLGDPKLAVAVSTTLEKSGWLVPAIRVPTVPRGTDRLRLSLSTAFQPEQIPQLVADILAAVKTAGQPVAAPVKLTAT